MKLKKFLGLFVIAMFVFALSGCGGGGSTLPSSSSGTTNETTNNGNTNNAPTNNNTNNNNTDTTTEQTVTDNNATGGSGETFNSSTAGTPAISVSSGTVTYSDVTVYKTGSPSDVTASSANAAASSEDYDWYGTNAAIRVSGTAVITISGDSKISSDATYASGVFVYGGDLSSGNGTGAKAIISDATITTIQNNSGGIMVTGGGVISADNLTITTSGGSSAAIRSDKGGGTINVNGGTYTANGQGSPAIYSTADITVNNATLNSGIAQGVVIEGGNSVTLNNTTVNANHTKLNGQDSTYQAVLIYQSQSGDAADGESSFTMNGGTITNANGDIFCVTNTTCTIDLSNVTINDNDSSGYFLRAAAQNWGSSGTNGGTVVINIHSGSVTGNIIVDSSSSVTMTIDSGASFSGTITNNGTMTINGNTISTGTTTYSSSN